LKQNFPGCGKSTFLSVLGNREVPIQDHIDIFFLAREVAASSKTALEVVINNHDYNL
jgi:ATP-binding cassette, subfamily F, member 2